MKKSFFCGCLLFIAISFQAHAQSPVMDMSITYTVDKEAITSVEKEVSYTNQSSKEFIKSVSFDLGSPEISDISVSRVNDDGEVNYETSTSQTTILDIEIDDPVLGTENILELLINYTDNTISSKTGKVLEINTPPLDDEDIKSINEIKIIIPISFGEPSFSNQPNLQVSKDNVFSTFTLEGTKFQGNSIRLTFGNAQQYRLNTTYSLNNPNLTPVETQIALPPDTKYQQTIIETIEPSPLKTSTDIDGNWIATYQLEPQESYNVELNAIIAVFSSPTIPAPSFINQYATAEDITYWPTSNQAIQDLASLHSSPEAIYKYIVNTFEYDYSRIDNQSTSRLGAVSAIENPTTSLCLEFSDAFIALARANNIPSRLITGVGFSENENFRPSSLVSNILHAWPEYYDAESDNWIPVDPTWEVTTGGVDYFTHTDTNHIALAIHAKDPEYPLPAGMYSMEPSSLSVSLEPNDPFRKESLEFSATSPITTKLGITKNIQVRITNRSNHALYNKKLIVRNETSDSIMEAPINHIIPYESKVISIPLTQDGFVARIPITISINEHSKALTIIHIPPLVSLSIIAGLGLTGVGFFLIKRT